MCLEAFDKSDNEINSAQLNYWSCWWAALCATRGDHCNPRLSSRAAEKPPPHDLYFIHSRLTRQTWSKLCLEGEKKTFASGSLLFNPRTSHFISFIFFCSWNLKSDWSGGLGYCFPSGIYTANTRNKPRTMTKREIFQFILLCLSDFHQSKIFDLFDSR